MGMTSNNLAISNIRSLKPGFDEKYYQIYQNLDDYVEKILNQVGVTVLSVSRLPGETNVNVRVKSRNGEYVIRISCWRRELLVSNVFYNTAYSRGIPVPEVVLYDDSCSVIPFEYQVVKFVESESVDKSQVRNAGKALGSTLRKLHSISMHGFGTPIDLERWKHASWLELLSKVYLHSDFMKARTAVYSKKEVAQIEKMTFENGSLEISDPKLIHGDVSINNCLFHQVISGMKLCALIDPGTIISGDPMFDMAMALNNEDEFSEGVKDGYDLSALTKEDAYRLERLRILCSYWTSCYVHETGGDVSKWKKMTLERLARCGVE